MAQGICHGHCTLMYLSLFLPQINFESGSGTLHSAIQFVLVF